MSDNIIHSRVSPSYLKQISLCSRSLPKDSEALDDTNQAAQTGTIQHACLSSMLADHFGLDAEKVDDSVLSIDEKNEVREVFDKAVDHYKSLRKKYARVDVMLEEKINLDSFLPNPSWGYVDICYIAHKAKPNREGIYENTLISVLDAKFGRVEVPIIENDKPNPQLTAYWCGIYDLIKDRHIVSKAHLGILQPKLSNYPTLSVKPTFLLDYMRDCIMPAAVDAMKPEGTYNPSLENCRYCKNSKHCKFHNIMAMAQLQMLENPDMLSDEYIEKNVLPNITSLKKYCDNVWDYAVRKSELQGKKWSGFTLGNARPSRVYIDENAVRDIAIKEGIEGLITTAVLSPAQAEKLLGKSRFSELLADQVTLKPGRTTLVPDAPAKKTSRQSLKNDFKENR